MFFLTQLITKNLIYSYVFSRDFHTNSICFSSFGKWYRGLWKPQKNEPPYEHIVQIGDPVLRQVCKSVPVELIKTKEIIFFIEQMKASLRSNTCVGLSSPQLGISLRIFLMEFTKQALEKYTAEERKTREMELLPLKVFINPELKVINFNKTIFTEACASIRGYAAEVPRYHEVLVSGYNENGELHKIQLKGWNARIAQHEFDHLDGKAYVDIMDTKTFNCTCWQAVNSKKGRIQISFYPR